MKKVSDNVLTPNQFMHILSGTMIGIGVLSLPNDVVKNAKQDGWIAAFIGAIYPLYIVIMSLFICKKFPNDNILFVNKKCFGKILGTLLNILLCLYFLLYITAVASGLSNILRTIIIVFLPSTKVLITIIFLGAYTAYKGLKVLGRTNETIFYLTLIMCLIPLVALAKGKVLNLRPILGSGVVNIIKASKESAFAYSGIEIMLLIYPYVSENKKLKKVAIKSIIITALIYTWVVFITIYGLGIDIIPTYIASFPIVVKYIELPVINNFRFIFMIMWALIVFKTISNYYYAIGSILSSLFLKTSYKKICIIIYPLIVFLSTRYVNEAVRRNFLSYIVPKCTIIMMIYILIIVILVYIRKEDKLE